MTLSEPALISAYDRHTCYACIETLNNWIYFCASPRLYDRHTCYACIETECVTSRSSYLPLCMTGILAMPVLGLTVRFLRNPLRYDRHTCYVCIEIKTEARSYMS